MTIKNIVTVFVSSIILLFGALKTNGDSWTSMEQMEFQSPSGKYKFLVTPHDGSEYRPGHCKGVLFRMDGTKRTEVWSRYLINNVGPLRVIVADSGEYVITMDEWGEIGKFPVVIYGDRGELISVHDLTSLGLKDNVHIEVSVSSYHWNENVITFFGPKERLLFIRLHWGKVIMIDLSDGTVCDKIWFDVNKKQDKRLQTYSKKKMRELALLKLRSKNSESRETGALVSGQLKLHKAIPHLKNLLHDAEYYMLQSGDDPSRKVYYVRKAAKEALEQMGIETKGIVIEEIESDQ